MDGWHHQLNGHEFKQVPGDDGQSSMACCSRWGLKESDTTERLNNNNTNIRPMGRGSFLLKALRGLVIQAVNLSPLPLDGMVSCGLPGENCRNPGPSLGGVSFPLNQLILTLVCTCKPLGRLIKPEGQDQPQTNKSEFGAMIL